MFSFFRRVKQEEYPEVEQVLSYVISLVAQPQELLEILAELKTKQQSTQMTRKAEYVQTYLTIEKFICTHQPPVTSAQFTPKSLHEAIGKVIQITTLPLFFRVVLLEGSLQLFTLYEDGVQNLTLQIINKFGLEKVKILVSAGVQGSILDKVPVDEHGVHFNELYHLAPTFSEKEVTKVFKNLLTALYEGDKELEGEKAALETAKTVFQATQFVYDEDLAYQFFLVIPDQVLEKEKVNFLNRQQLLNVLQQLNAEKVMAEESRQKNDALLESIGEGAFATDQEGKVIFVNRVTLEILGLQEFAMIGKHWSETVKTLDESGMPLPLEKNPIDIALKTKAKVTELRFCYLRSDGSSLPVAMTASAILTKDQVTGAMVVFRDMTREREIDREKTEFISIASHQLRTPIGSIKWNLEMLLKGYYGTVTPEMSKVVEQMRATNDHLLQLVNNLLDVSRIDQGRIKDQPVPTAIVPIIESIIKEVQVQADVRKITLTLKVDAAEAPTAVIDPQRFREVIENLLSNAIKYNLDAGKVDVHVSWNEKTIQISIKDTGMGIPQKDQAKIFGRFFRAENAAKQEPNGSGLGLFVVKSYVEEWGGKIWFESPVFTEKDGNDGEQSRGTCFYIEVPR